MLDPCSSIQTQIGYTSHRTDLHFHAQTSGQRPQHSRPLFAAGFHVQDSGQCSAHWQSPSTRHPTGRGETAGTRSPCPPARARASQHCHQIPPAVDGGAAVVVDGGGYDDDVGSAFALLLPEVLARGVSPTQTYCLRTYTKVGHEPATLAAEHWIPRNEVSLDDPVALGDEGARAEHGHEPKSRCSRPRCPREMPRRAIDRVPGWGCGSRHGIGSVMPQSADRSLITPSSHCYRCGVEPATGGSVVHTPHALPISVGSLVITRSGAGGAGAADQRCQGRGIGHNNDHILCRSAEVIFWTLPKSWMNGYLKYNTSLKCGIWPALDRDRTGLNQPRPSCTSYQPGHDAAHPARASRSPLVGSRQ